MDGQLLRFEDGYYPMFERGPCEGKDETLVMKRPGEDAGICLQNPCPSRDEVFLFDTGRCVKLTDETVCQKPLSVRISLHLGIVTACNRKHFFSENYENWPFRFWILWLWIWTCSGQADSLMSEEHASFFQANWAVRFPVSKSSPGRLLLEPEWY